MKLLTVFLTMIFFTLSFQPTLAKGKKDPKGDDTSAIVGAYASVMIAYRILSTCDESYSKLLPRIQNAALRKKEGLFKKHRFTKAEQAEISTVLSDVDNEETMSLIKIEREEGVPSICDVYAETARKNIDAWIK